MDTTTSIETSQHLSLLSPEDFVASIKDVLSGPNDDPEGLYYRFTFKAGETVRDVPITDRGKLLHSPEDLETIKAQYTKMTELLDVFITKGFQVSRLILVNKTGLAGVQIDYISPNDRATTGRYVSSTAPFDIIPKDFLYDLEHIPKRAY